MNAIEICGLTIVGPDGTRVLDAPTLTVETGTATAVIGPSGSGKTALAHAMVGHFRSGLTPVAGDMRVGGHDVVVDGRPVPSRLLRTLRRRHITYVGQDPGTALTPSMSIGDLIDELRPAGAQFPLHLLAAVGLPTDDDFLRRRPGHLSGGQRRRVALVRALAADTGVVVLDEPTAGLDSSSARSVAGAITRLVESSGATAVVVTHDLAIAGSISDRTVRMDAGRVTDDSRRTRPALPGPAPVVSAPTDPNHDHLLVVEHLHLRHRGRDEPICRDASFEIGVGEAVGLRGDSGSGKSTLARAVVGLHRPRSGRIVLAGRELAPTVAGRGRIDTRAVALIPQDPASTLNPALSVGAGVAQRLVRSADERLPRRRIRERVCQLLTDVGLDPALADRRPGQLSGGQRQRIAVARGLASAPDLLICDEVTASLDAAATERIIELLAELRERRRVALLVIAHQTHVIEALCSRTIAMADLAGPPDDRETGATAPRSRLRWA